MSLKKSFKAAKNQLRTLRLAIGKTILDKKPSGKAIDFHNIKSILFLRQDGKIGDFIVSSFVFREIKQQRPDIQIGILCHDSNAHLCEDEPHIDHVHRVAKRGMLPYWQAGKKLQNQYDIVIDPTYLLRNRDLLLLRTINAPFNVGYEKSDYRLFNVNVTGDLHYTEVYQRALSLCGFAAMDTTYALPVRPSSAIAIQAFLAQSQLHDYIAVNFFGASNSRTFSTQNIADIMRDLHQQFPQQQWVLLGYPAVNDMLVQLNLPQCHVYHPTQTIHDNIELMRHAKAVISPDTAIVHIAVGLNKPLIAMYSNLTQNFINWHPHTDNVQMVRYQENINEINSQQLISAIQKLNFPVQAA